MKEICGAQANEIYEAQVMEIYDVEQETVICDVELIMVIYDVD